MDAESNIGITFTDGGISSSATLPNTRATVDEAGRVAFPEAPSNPAEVTLQIKKSTGAISGAFALRDPDPENPGKELLRKLKFEGLFVPAVSEAGGFFLLPQVASPPATTGKTAPILSGAVRIAP